MSSEVEDLFGDDIVVQEGDRLTAPRTSASAKPAEDVELSDGEDLFGDANKADSDVVDSAIEQDAIHESSESESEITSHFEVPNFQQPTGDTAELYLAKMPSFLGVSTVPYDADNLLSEIQQEIEDLVDTDEKMTRKRSLVNTLRWKYDTGPNIGGARSSNARFVGWNDGSLSLQLGEELFDVPVKNMVREHSYLTLMHAEEGLLRGMQRFSKTMSFQPFGLSSKSHAELKADIARRAISSKGRTVKLHTEMIDPADFQKQAIKADNEKQKARRRLDNQKARTMNYSNNNRDRTQLTARYLDDSDEELGSGQRYADDNDDGFIEDDEVDAEEQAGRSRLQALKEAGTATYKERQNKKSRAQSDEDQLSDDESIVYDEDDREESEEEAVMTPRGDQSPVALEEVNAKTKNLKRRIVDSDDEDDD